MEEKKEAIKKLVEKTLKDPTNMICSTGGHQGGIKNC